MFVLVKLLVFAPLYNAQKKHVLNYFALEMAAIIVARGGTAENKERVVEGRGIKNILSKHIVCQAMLFLICFRK